MRLTTRFFEVSGQYKLVPFETLEGEEVSLPDGSVLVHSEPIIEEGGLAGFDLWALVPSERMAEAINEVVETL